MEQTGKSQLKTWLIPHHKHASTALHTPTGIHKSRREGLPLIFHVFGHPYKTNVSFYFSLPLPWLRSSPITYHNTSPSQVSFRTHLRPVFPKTLAGAGGSGMMVSRWAWTGSKNRGGGACLFPPYLTTALCGTALIIFPNLKVLAPQTTGRHPSQSGSQPHLFLHSRRF